MQAGSQPGLNVGAQHSRQSWSGSELTGPRSADEAIEFIKDYARERPEVVALWAFGLGFILGWKLKPW